MGSQCTILNDLHNDVLIKHSINYQVFSALVERLHARLDAAAKKHSACPLGCVTGVLGGLADKIKSKIEDDINDMASAKLIKPGEKYTWSGTLFLHMRVYVVNDKQQSDDRACFTGPTPGSEYVYPISEYFKKLDVKTD